MQKTISHPIYGPFPSLKKDFEIGLENEINFFEKMLFLKIHSE